MYSQYRNEILKVHSKVPLKHLEVRQSGFGPQGEELWTDYFYSPEKKEKCLIHLSGVHGVEGYLGSFIQRRLLEITKEAQAWPFQVVFVHSVNPYGMAWKLRTNSQNVDLNRNSLLKHEIDNPYFQNFVPLFRSGKFKDLLPALLLFLKVGKKTTIESAACGQTTDPTSLFYAGSQLQDELVSLEKTLKGLISSTAQVWALDLHTGLGKLGEESLIVDGFDPEERIFEDIFQKEICWPGVAPGIYQSQGTLSALFKKTWNTKYCFQEFGTYSFYRVLNTLIHRDPEQMLQTFFPDQEAWRNRCVDLGLLRFQQLVQTLSKSDPNS